MHMTARNKIRNSDHLFDLSFNAGFGKASAPATCGELIQGFIYGQDFLINSPIDLYSAIRVLLTEDSEVKVSTPGNFSKVAAVVRQTLDHLGATSLGAKVFVDSMIPRGKGMASSTSELTSAIYATANACSAAIEPHEVMTIILNVDKSSDSVFLPGINRCNHLTGDVLEEFGHPPPLAFLIVDCGGEVETIGFDRAHARMVAKNNSDRLEQALLLLRQGFRGKNASLIALASTMSAEVNQKVLYKAELSDLVEGTKEFGGLGVNCAHTGTVLGVMFDPNKTSEVELRNRVAFLVGKERILGVHSLIAGGILR